MTAKESIILHVGMAKAGSTSIQSGMKGFSDGITRYARMGISNHSVPLMTIFRTDPSRHLYYRKRGMDGQAVAAAANEQRQRLMSELDSAERHLIFSGEDLCRLTKSEVGRMKALLEGRCERFRVLAYIREPISYPSSVFQQVVRHRQLTTLSAPMPKYRLWFEKYIEAFGRNAIEFVLFEPARFTDACIVTDFCERVGIDSSLIAKNARNESLSSEAVALLLQWNRDGQSSHGTPADVRATNRLIALLRKTFPGCFSIHRDLAEAAVDEEDRRWMEQVGGFSLQAPQNGEITGGVASDEDLNALAVSCVPHLQALLAAGSINGELQQPSALLDALYQDIRKSSET